MNPSIEFGLCLLAAHLAVDFAGPVALDVGRVRRPFALLGHGLLVAALGYALAGRWQAWAAPLAVFLTHAGIDHIMSRRSRSLEMFVADQAAHLLIIVALAAWPAAVNASPSCWAAWLGRDWSRLLVLAAGGIACVRVVGVLVGFWVKPYLDEIEQPNPTRAAVVRGLSNGGRTIGQWERALILLFLLMNQPAGIGFLIAAKSIFRFGELKDRENRMEAEYITIGTLMSFALAIGVAWLTVRWLRIL